MGEPKRIDTQGITYIEPLDGSHEWYWGTDYASGDLYEAEEAFRQGYPMNPNRLVFVHYPDGKAVQPVAAGKGQYLGQPVYYDNKIFALRVDFPAGRIEILQLDDAMGPCMRLAALSLSDVKDCYNLMLEKSPLMLTRQGSDNKFQILWPERTQFQIGDTETFYSRMGGELYFSAWHEDSDYREETIVRRADTGEIISRISGGIQAMPDGQMWILG